MNSLAELLGLGSTLAFDFLIVAYVATAQSVKPSILSIIMYSVLYWTHQEVVRCE